MRQTVIVQLADDPARLVEHQAHVLQRLADPLRQCARRFITCCLAVQLSHDILHLGGLGQATGDVAVVLFQER